MEKSIWVLYSSKFLWGNIFVNFVIEFLWGNIFVNFVINLKITKFHEIAGHKVAYIVCLLKNGQGNIESQVYSDHDFFITKIYFSTC